MGIGYVIQCKIASIASPINMNDATINRVECLAENITFETQIMNSTSRGNGQMIRNRWTGKPEGKRISLGWLHYPWKTKEY